MVARADTCAHIRNGVVSTQGTPLLTGSGHYSLDSTKPMTKPLCAELALTFRRRKIRRVDTHTHTLHTAFPSRAYLGNPRERSLSHAICQHSPAFDHRTPCMQAPTLHTQSEPEQCNTYRTYNWRQLGMNLVVGPWVWMIAPSQIPITNWSRCTVHKLVRWRLLGHRQRNHVLLVDCQSLQDDALPPRPNDSDGLHG